MSHNVVLVPEGAEVFRTQEIISLLREHESIQAVANHLGISRHRLARFLAAQGVTQQTVYKTHGGHSD